MPRCQTAYNKAARAKTIFSQDPLQFGLLNVQGKIGGDKRSRKRRQYCVERVADPAELSMTPILAAINAVLHDGLSPSVAIEELMTRAAREEFS